MILCYNEQMEILSAHEVAHYLDVNPKEVYLLAREGAIPHTRIGGTIVFTRDVIDKWTVANTKQELSLYVAGSDDAFFKAITKAYTAQTSNFIFMRR